MKYATKLTAMFERPHQQGIALALEALDAKRRGENNCLFAGGTIIALGYGEYRESVDIDFLVSDIAGYRNLRQRLTAVNGIGVMTGYSVAT